MIDFEPTCHRMLAVLAGITDEALTAATPCAEYTVGDLIDHVDTLSRVFAAVGRKEPGGPSQPGESSGANLGTGWRDRVANHVRELGKAWQDPAAWQGETTAVGLTFGNQMWGQIALTEILVHGWDLAASTGQPFEPPESAVQFCYDHVVAFTTGAPIEGLWGPAVEVPTAAPLLNQLLGLTGRDPVQLAASRTASSASIRL